MNEHDPIMKQAFCTLLFASNGGTFLPSGDPLFAPGVKGSCDEAYDCGRCPLMGQWLDQRAQEGSRIGWECVGCLNETKGEGRSLPGFFQSGWVDEPGGLDGCTRCGFETSFLQLVLRR
jgi:hypothetical protein